MSYGIPKNNSRSASNTNALQSSTDSEADTASNVPSILANNTNSLQSSTENEADTASNVPLTTGNERPVSLELQPALSAQESAQVSIP